MSASYADKNVLCPFYRENGKQKIRCEGYCDGTSEITTFPSDKKKLEYMAAMCCGDYMACGKCRALWAKYEKP